MGLYNAVLLWVKDMLLENRPRYSGYWGKAEIIMEGRKWTEYQEMIDGTLL
jgi:hypothetical protein